MLMAKASTWCKLHQSSFSQLKKKPQTKNKQNFLSSAFVWPPELAPQVLQGGKEIAAVIGCGCKYSARCSEEAELCLTVKAVGTSLICVITCSFQAQLLLLPNPEELWCYQLCGPRVLSSCCPSPARRSRKQVCFHPCSSGSVPRWREWVLRTAVG